MIPPITLIVKLLQQRSPVIIWLFEQLESKIEGKIRGVDEYMNLVIDDAINVSEKNGSRKELGRILLKADNIAMIQAAE